MALTDRMPDSAFTGRNALKQRVQERLLARLDFSAMSLLDPVMLRAQLAMLVMQILEEDGAAFNDTDREEVINDVMNEILGLGPWSRCCRTRASSHSCKHRDAHLRGAQRKAVAEPQALRDNRHLRDVIDKIVARVGRRIDESSPMVDARLEDGSRVNAIIPPLALDGPILSIRKFCREQLQLEHLVARGAVTSEIGEMLKAMVYGRLNILIAGGTGVGKPRC